MRTNKGCFAALTVAGLPLLLSSLHAALGLRGGATLVPSYYATVTATGADGVVVTGLTALTTALWLGLAVGVLRADRPLTRRCGSVAGLSAALLGGWSAVVVSTSGAARPVAPLLLSTVAVVCATGVATVTAPGRTTSGETSGPRVGPSGADHDGYAADGSGVDEATLERLEPLIPDAVERARVRDGDDAVQQLYHGIEDAVAEGKLSMGVVSTYDTQYEVVNLPTRFRELELSVPDGRYHIGTLEGQVRTWIDDEGTSIRELSLAVEAILEHKAAIDRFVSDHEREFERLHRTVRSDLESVRTLATQLDGAVGDRTRQLVLENRHAELAGVTAIEEDVRGAKRALHRCAFDEATTRLQELADAADDLLTAVDFFRSFVGGIEHGQSGARLPNDQARTLYVELEPLFEDQYDVELSVDGDRVVIADHEADDEQADESTQSTDTASTRDGGQTVSSANPAEVTDEILYILREFKNGDTSGTTVEYQTERLPESIARPDVLAALADFCRRRSGIVKSVTVQEDAPPGFFEIEFTGSTECTSGLDTLASSFADHYGAHK